MLKKLPIIILKILLKLFILSYLKRLKNLEANLLYFEVVSLISFILSKTYNKGFGRYFRR